MRIQSIDYLRGLMALSVVLYHFSIMFNRWGDIDSGTTLGRLGVYAVSAFYVISGMAMYLSHKSGEWSLLRYVIFIIKRFLRLAPVYWLALGFITIASILFSKNFKFDFIIYIQNIFLTFGLTNPSGYLVMGGWSIGNEIVFYLLFPLFILLTKSNALLVILINFSTISLFYCAFWYMNADIGLGEQWVHYINPLNQIFYFTFGIILAKVLLPFVGYLKPFFIMASIVLFSGFVLFPVGGDLINIITGWNKIYFSVLIIMICACFFMIGDLVSIKPLHVALKFLGDISYPLYLLHGVTFICLKGFLSSRNIPADTMLLIGVAVILLLFLASWICHILIEIPIISFSKKITSVKKVKVNGIASG